MLDQRTPTVTAESIRTEKIDAPQGATVLRIEPVLSDSDSAKGIDLVCVTIINYPDGSRVVLPSVHRTGGKSRPRSERRMPQSMDGAKIEAYAFSVSGPVEMSVRVTAGDEKTIPARLETKDEKGAK